MTSQAARTAFVIAPSPLQGEGSVIWHDHGLGEGYSSRRTFDEETPSPDSALLHHLHALSLEGRGHSNERPCLGGSA
jgi:hypothetical protein